MVRHSCHYIKLSSNHLCDSNRTRNKKAMVNNKGWFSLAMESDRSHNHKRSTFNDLEKQRSDSGWDSIVYDQVKTRLSESQAEAEGLNQSQSLGTCIVIGLSYRFCFRLRRSPSYSGYQMFFSCVRRGASSAAGRFDFRPKTRAAKPR